MSKTHALLGYKVGLFENNITACGASGKIIQQGVLKHHLNGAKYLLAEEFPSCKTCQCYLEDNYS